MHTGIVAETPPHDSLPKRVASVSPSSSSLLNDPAGMQEILAAIVESSDDAIISKDLNGTILSWNSGAERVFGYRADEAIGRSITMLLPPDRFDEEVSIIATLVRGERIDHFETERLTKDGRRIDISLSVSPIKDRTGRVIGGAKIARDISLRRELERAREQALEQERQGRALAEAANRSKDAFLAMRQNISSGRPWISSCVAGGLKLCSVLMALHIGKSSSSHRPAP